MKAPVSKKWFLFFAAVSLAFFCSAQCPTVNNTSQSFCDLDSLRVSDLQANDTGAGIAWFNSPAATTPLSSNASLNNGATYYLDNATGNCGNRIAVTVSILGPPIGLSFQGVCVEDPAEATLEDLEVIGNNINWYASSSSNTPLALSTNLIDNTIYYANQENPATGCRTSRLAVLVNIGIVPVPTGESLQQFCLGLGQVPTIADLVASGNNFWYSSIFSASPLDPSTPLVDGEFYYATISDPPCESINRFEVQVILVDQVSAGTDGSLEICTDTNQTFDLFQSLGGNPEQGGIWSPALNSGTGIFDPNIDTEGTYTYTVSNADTQCPNDSATVTVSFRDPPIAGENESITICSDTNNAFDLFDSLGGTPDPGGIWSPALNSGTGIFDPSIDAEGTYTYTVASSDNACSDASATVSVSFLNPPQAGNDGSLEICLDDTSTFDLFDSLGGTPDVGGTWSPALNSGTGIFDPTIDAEGIYTYIVASSNDICSDDSATVTVNFLNPPQAGTDGSVTICSNETDSFDLFDSLGGTPDAGGTWSPTLNSGTGIFDPSIDAEGTYTYTVASSDSACSDASATVSVSFLNPPQVGNDGSLEICLDDTSTFDLFDSLGGTPDVGGTWSPTLNSGTGIFDPSVDPEGIYTYTVTSSNSVCLDASATVTVSFLNPPQAGTDGSLTICSDDTDTVDLFDSLGGTPDAGGTWSPALNSGTGIFDPSIDVEGIYTYTVTSSNDICSDASAAVAVSILNPPQAGTDGSITICSDDTNSFDLFDSLGGTPDAGGTWSPALNSGTGIFDPSIDVEGIYTYTVTSSNDICSDASAAVTVSILDPPQAGNDGSLEICLDDTSTFDLFDSLGGTPDASGTWSPALNSGTGIFDPATDSEGIYTYTVSSSNSSCSVDSATVTVSFINPPQAGTDGSITICADDTELFDLFGSLGGTPDTGGTWSPTLNSGSGIFDPTIDTEGIYTYTVESSNEACSNASATVTVSILNPPQAGTDSFLTICSNENTTFDLFNSLAGSPDPGGTWSPVLNSGTGIFDPSIDEEGIYTYTVPSNQCGSKDSAEVTVTIIPSPTISNIVISIDDVCQGFDVSVSLEGLEDLENGDYIITYEISGNNSVTGSVTVTSTGEAIAFVLESNLFPFSGLHTFNIVSVQAVSTGCFATLDSDFSENFQILESPSPEIIAGGNIFCVDEAPTLEDLTVRIVDNNGIEWYDSETSLNPLPINTVLVNGVTYFASIINNNGCSSFGRLSVEITLDDCIEDLIIPDGFSPNGDSVNDTFHIVNLDVLYPNFNLTIFNRYGNKLYEGNINTPRWDGTTTTNRIGNSIVPTGVYFFIIEFNDGIRKAMQGRVYLSR